MNFKRVLKNYLTGLWTKEMVKRAYMVGVITQEQYLEIVSYPQGGEEVVEVVE